MMFPSSSNVIVAIALTLGDAPVSDIVAKLHKARGQLSPDHYSNHFGGIFARSFNMGGILTLSFNPSGAIRYL